MGFFDLFKKKSEKLTKEQIDQIEEKIEESEEKHIKDGVIFSDLKKPAKTKSVKVAKPTRKKAKKQSKKKAKKQARKARRSAKKKGKKRR